MIKKAHASSSSNIMQRVPAPEPACRTEVPRAIAADVAERVWMLVATKGDAEWLAVANKLEAASHTEVLKALAGLSAGMSAAVEGCTRDIYVFDGIVVRGMKVIL